MTQLRSSPYTVSSIQDQSMTLGDTLIITRAVRLCLLRQLHVAKRAHLPTRRIRAKLRIATAEAMG